MKNILITGISRGLGLLLTEMLLSNSHDCVIYGVSRTKSDELNCLLERYPQRLKWLSFDLNCLDQIEQRVFDDFIGKDTVITDFVNNAAILYKDLILRINIERMEELFRVNVHAPFVLCKCVVRNFLQHKTAGSIVHLSSICAHKGFDGLSMMGATKSAIEAFSRTLAKEYGRKGIRSNVVVVGLLDIGMGHTVNNAQMKDLFSQSALGKVTDYKSVLSMTEYLLSENANSITGQTIHVNAGIT